MISVPWQGRDATMENRRVSNMRHRALLLHTSITFLTAIAACSDQGSGDGNSAGRAGALAGSAGTIAPPPAGAGMAGTPIGGAAVGGVAGASSVAGATAGGSGAAGAPLAGFAGGGMPNASAGTAGALGGASGLGGVAGAAGSLGGTGGLGGAGKGGGATGSDRCDIAKHDPADPPQALTLTGSLGVHDPVLILAHGQYYLFSTGGNQGLSAKTGSVNLLSWQNAPGPLNPNPSWTGTQVPGVANLWAPDISYFGGLYHLYYSASTFGSNRSCIGHATRSALNAGNWADQGQVICSNPNGGTADNWNAIDANVIIDEAGTGWLSFGSFWGGIKMIELDATGARANTMLHSLAARPANRGALEAPFIVRRCGFYYLFVSFDSCCMGANSTYKIMVGRSAAVTGPYTDRAGTPMMEGGGTLLVEGGTRWKGPGHNAVLFTETAAYNVYHSYDANTPNGNATLRISELVWDADGWPISGGP